MPRILLQIIMLSMLPVIAFGRSIEAPKTFVNINMEAEAGVVYYSLCQDSAGMVWVGTNMGLLAYDGYQLHRHLGNEAGNNTNVNCLMMRGDLLYAGADAGVLVYDVSVGQYVPYGIAFPTDVRSMAFDGDKLWVGSLKGLYQYDASAGSLHDFSRELPHQAVYAVELTQHGDLYVGTYNGLCRFDRAGGKFVDVSPAIEGRKNNLFVNALADDTTRNCLWVGTEGALYRLGYGRGEVARMAEFDGQSIKSLATDADGNLVVGTDNGLYIYSEHRLECYRHDSRIATSLSNNVVWSVMVDRDGNLWAGTESGLSEWVNGGDFSVVPIYQLTGSSDGSRFYAIFRDSRGYLWLGGTNGLIRRSANGEVKWYQMDSKEYPLRHNRVRSIYEDSKYELWIATDGGVNRYNYISEQFVNYDITDSTGVYNANWAYGIVEDNKGRMWVGSYLGGLLAVGRDRLVASGGGKCVAEESYNSTNQLPNNMINQVAMSRDGSRWASLYKSGTIVHIGEKADGGDEVRVFDVCDSYIQYIVPDRRSGGLWCGYHNGFALVADCDTVVSRHTFPGTSDIDVYAMCLVRRNLWITTSRGVWVLNAKTGEMQHLRLPGKLYTSIYYDRATKMVLLGGFEELTVVDPLIVERNEAHREIALTALYVNGKPYVGTVADIERIELSHDQNHIMVEFSDFDYSPTNRKGFEYRMAGVSDEWIALPPDDNRIELSGMGHGDYVLEIRPADAASETPVATRKLDIEVKPAWYASWWAITAYVLIGILFVLWVLNFLRLKIKLRMERVRSEKTLEMVNSRMEFLTNISHELKTPLSMIIGPLSKMLNEEKNPETRRHLGVIQQNALKLNTLVHRALEVNRMDALPDNMLIYSQVEMVQFCRSIFDTYRESFPAKQFVFSCGEERIFVSADVVKMESVINNILSNACKYSGDGATVALSMERKGGDVVIAVSDDGVGIPKDELPLIFQRLYQSSATKGNKEGTGIGLYLAKTYVEMHHGTIQVDSTEGVGSVFTITIPVGDVDDTKSEAVSDSADVAGKLRVVIVEDNAGIASFIRDILKDTYNCTIANNGKAGLAVCNSVQPDLIIADMMMPVMDGLEMCRRIKRSSRLAAVPIILLTAKDDRLTEAESIKIGIDAFMSKPFEADMLLGRVEQLLKSKEAMRSNLRVESITAVKQEAVESADEKLLAEVTKVVEDNIADPDMNVGYVCDKLGLSSKQLYRLLKNYTGVSAVDYIKQIRLKKAAMLLQQHKFTVSEVMYMVGFSSTSYFSKCFTAQFGCSPRQYAEKHSFSDD